MDKNKALRLLKSLRLMAERNDVIQDTHGNVSVLDGTRALYIKPSGVPYNEITIDSIPRVEFDDEGKVTNVTSEDGLRPSVDTEHHIRIYLDNPDVKAICHTHSPHAVAHAIAGRTLLCYCTEHADYFGGPIRCCSYQDLDNWSKGILEFDPIEDFYSRKAVLLRRHGVLTFAADPVEAVNLGIQLENVARKNLLAEQLTHNYIDPMPSKEVQKWHWRYQNVYGQR